MSTSTGQVTLILRQIAEGDRAKWSDLLQLVHADLLARADRFMRREPPGHPMQPADLIHEAWIRLDAQTRVYWKNREQFFAVASVIMWRILVDIGRRQDLETSITVFEIGQEQSTHTTQLCRVRSAVRKLEDLDTSQAMIVKLRFFGGLTEEQVSEVLEIPLRTLQREWAFIKTWLKRELSGEEGNQAP